MTSVATKICRKCGDEKPLDGFHKQASSRDGRQAYCRECNSATANALKAERRKADPAYALELSNYKRAHYAANREHDKAAAREWRANNPERVAAQQLAYAENFPERRIASSARYRQQNREARRAAYSLWAKTNPLAVRNNVHRRRARLLKQTVVSFTAAQLEARMAYFGFACWMCGGEFEHIDHVKPLSKLGPHMLSNLRPACANCNTGKGSRWFGTRELHRFTKN